MVIGKTAGFSPVPLSGGLNTSYPHTNLEPNESPDIMNMQVDFDGSLVKRKGFTTLQTATSTPFTYTLSYAPICIPITTPYGRNLMIVRNNNDIVVYAESGATGYWTAVKTFSNMFRESVLGVSAATAAWSHTVLNEAFTTKIILTHPSFVPLQLTFYFGSTNAATYTTTTVAVNNLPPFMDTTYLAYTDMFGFFDTGAVGIPTNYSDAITPPAWGTGTWTFSSTGHTTSTWRFDYVICCLQWWGEALLLNGDQFVATAVNGVSSRDIPVPISILNDIDAYTTGRYPIHVYSSSGYDAKLTFTTPPTTTSQWSFSSGEYVASGGSRLSPSPYWVTIGADVTTSRTLLLNRGYKLPFYGGQGADIGMSGGFNSALIVRDMSGSQWSRYNVAPPTEGGAGGGTTDGFHLRNTSFNVITATTAGSRTGTFISLDGTGTANGGLGQVVGGSQYSIHDTRAKTHYDNNRLGQVSGYTDVDGDYTTRPLTQLWADLRYPSYMSKSFPVYGISDYCNYATGSFPAVSAVCQSRLAIAGMTSDPLRVAFSNVQDSHSVPGIYCNNFQTALESDYDEDSGFDIALSSRGDDRITALLEYNDKLFVWTKYKTFMIYSDTNVLNYATAKYSVVAEKGCANCRAVALMDNTPVFISNDGVYAVVPNDKSSGYGVEEISIKIRKVFTENSSLLSQYGWLLYDSSRKELYAGLVEDSGFTFTGASTTSKAPLLFVFKPQFRSWVQYSIDGYSFPAYGGCIIYQSSGLSRVMLSMACNAGAATQQRLCEGNNNYYADLLDVDTWTSGTKTPDFGAHKLTWYYTGATDYSWENYPDTGTNFAKAIPYREYNDLRVYWETSVGSNAYTQLTEGTEYVKTQYGIRLIQAHPSGGNVRVLAFLVIRGKSDTRTDYDYPCVCVQDGLLKTPFEFSINGFGGDQYIFTFNGTFTPTSSSLYMGTMYAAWVTTPAITGDTLTTKNVKHYILYLDNRLAPVNSKVRISVNVGLMYDDEFLGFLSEEVYGYLYDDTRTGLWYTTDMYGQQQYKSYSRVLFPVMGSYQLMNAIHFTYSPCTFKLVGYEVEYVKTKREGYSSSENQTLR